MIDYVKIAHCDSDINSRIRTASSTPMVTNVIVKIHGSSGVLQLDTIKIFINLFSDPTSRLEIGVKFWQLFWTYNFRCTVFLALSQKLTDAL